MDKIKFEEILDRTVNFIEQLVIDKFEVTDINEFEELTTFYKNTTFYKRNKDLLNLKQYKDMKDVYEDMIFKIEERPFLSRIIIAGLFPVMYDKYKEMTK